MSYERENNPDCPRIFEYEIFVHKLRARKAEVVRRPITDDIIHYKDITKLFEGEIKEAVGFARGYAQASGLKLNIDPVLKG